MAYEKGEVFIEVDHWDTKQPRGLLLMQCITFLVKIKNNG